MLRRAWSTSKNLVMMAGGLLALVLILLWDQLFFGLSPMDVSLPLLLALLLSLPVWYLVNRKGLPWWSYRRLREENAVLRQAAAQAERRFRNLFDNAGDAIFFIHPETGAVLEINRQGEELLGYPEHAIPALPLSRLFPGRERRRYLRLVKTVLREGYGEEPDLLVRRQDGQTFHGAAHARLGDLDSRQVVHCVLRDISEMKRIETELRQKNRNLALVNQIAHQAAGSRDSQVMLETILDEVIETFSAAGGGVYLSRHQGTELHLLVHRGVSEEALADMRKLPVGQGLAGRVAASGRPRSSPDLRRDSRVWSAAVRDAGWQGYQAVPLISDQRTVGVLFFFTYERRIFSRDEVNLLLAIGKQVGGAVDSVELYDALQWQYRLTEASNRELELSRRQLRESLTAMEDANRALAETDRMKNNFLALASHELRTPLTYILSGAELLGETLKGRLNQEEGQILHAIHQGGRRLHEIVQDLLDITRIESNIYPLSLGTIHLPALFAEIDQEFQPVFRQRALNFQIAELPVKELCGDARQLGKTFRRLVENAVKFTPEGGRIAITARIRQGEEIRREATRLRNFSPAFFSRTPPETLLQVTVRDDGVGIDLNEQVKIFDKFYEIGDPNRHFTSHTRFGGKGVGLGLSLVKGVVEAHNGMTWVESPGAGHRMGSAFHVLLPLSTPSEEATDDNHKSIPGDFALPGGHPERLPAAAVPET